MTTSSRNVDRMAGQVSPSGVTATLAAGALMLTSALLTFLVGVFALAANDLVVSGPGYEYTFQITGWGWANILTGDGVGRRRHCPLLERAVGTSCGNHRHLLGHRGHLPLDAVLPDRLDCADSP